VRKFREKVCQQKIETTKERVKREKGGSVIDNLIKRESESDKKKRKLEK
jgi:hypothetical protein